MSTPCSPSGFQYQKFSVPWPTTELDAGAVWCTPQPPLSGRLHRPWPSRLIRALDYLTSLCERLGVPLAPHKLVNPTTCLIFLGIEVDSVTSQLRLPADKLARVRLLISEWRGWKACRRKDLESLVGLLNHACEVVRSGRSFLRRMLDLLHSREHASHGTTMISPKCQLPGRPSMVAGISSPVEWDSILTPTRTLAQSGTMHRRLRYMGLRGVLAR